VVLAAPGLAGAGESVLVGELVVPGLEVVGLGVAVPVPVVVVPGVPVVVPAVVVPVVVVAVVVVPVVVAVANGLVRLPSAGRLEQPREVESDSTWPAAAVICCS
jgi:hypothetical protein